MARREESPSGFHSHHTDRFYRHQRWTAKNHIVQLTEELENLDEGFPVMKQYIFAREIRD